MNSLTVLGLALALAGFVLGLFVPLKVLLRSALGLVLVCGLGLVLSNYGGWEAVAYGFGVAMAGVVLAFGVALAGAAAAALIRRLLGIAPVERRERELNSLIH